MNCVCFESIDIFVLLLCSVFSLFLLLSVNFHVFHSVFGWFFLLLCRNPIDYSVLLVLFCCLFVYLFVPGSVNLLRFLSPATRLAHNKWMQCRCTAAGTDGNDNGTMALWPAIAISNVTADVAFSQRAARRWCGIAPCVHFLLIFNMNWMERSKCKTNECEDERMKEAQSVDRIWKHDLFYFHISSLENPYCKLNSTFSRILIRFWLIALIATETTESWFEMKYTR